MAFATHARRPAARLGFETLEARENPAGGNVAVSFGEVLQLRGDGASNHVRVTQDSTGLVVSGQNGTTVNGRTSVRSSARPEKVDIKLFGGDDRLDTRGLRASVDINIDMDRGNDIVDLRDTSAGVNLSIKTADGVDTVRTERVRTGGDLSIETGEGTSSVKVFQTTVGKTLTVIGGLSADRVVIDQTRTVRGDINVELKEGNDRAYFLDARSGKNLTANMGKGDDLVVVTNVFVANDAVFLGEDGFDTFENNGVTAGEKLEIKGFNRRR